MYTAWTEEDAFLVAERAHLWAMQGQLEQAAVLFAGLIVAVPDYPYAQRALAAIYLKTERAADALALLDAAPALRQDWEARRLRLEALLELGWRRHAESELAALRGGLDPAMVERFATRLESLRS